MLSVLIPVYNYAVIPLVKELQLQMDTLKIEGEIVCIDDGSDKKYQQQNGVLADQKIFPLVSYLVLKENIGRSKIRNLLITKAKFQYALFLDCDSRIIRDSFLSKYLEHAGNWVLYGGREFPENKPKGQGVLRWKYGRDREVVRVSQRVKNPYKAFMSNNFLIPVALYKAVKSDENICGYGHEDTVFAFDLRDKNIAIQHIDNPVLNEELETADVFLEKTKNGIKNLALLVSSNRLSESTKLFSYYKWIKLFWVNALFVSLFKPMIPWVLRNLKSANPSLMYFDFLKLYWLSLEMKQK